MQGQLVVELPAGNQVLHGDGIVARAQAVLQYRALARLQRLPHVHGRCPGPASGAPRTRPPTICSGSLVRRWPSCQIQWVSMAVTLARCGGGHMGEHGQGDVEVVVGVRAPGQAPVAAGLAHAHRAGHGPEMRVGQRNIDGLQRQRMGHLAPVGGNHVGGRGQAGGAAELGHHLAAENPPSAPQGSSA